MSFRLKGHKFSEYDGHGALATWLEVVRNQLKSFSYHSSPSGLIQPRLLGMAFKAGARKGWPDMQFHLKDGTTFFIEFKRGKTKVSDNQKIIHKELREIGYSVYVARFGTPDECIEKVKHILNSNYSMGITI